MVNKKGRQKLNLVGPPCTFCGGTRTRKPKVSRWTTGNEMLCLDCCARRGSKRIAKLGRPWLRAWTKAYNWKRRSEVIRQYGGKCACCGEAHFEFLQLDHINGGGTKDRKLGGWGSLALRLYKKPMREDIRVLCANCNLALGKVGSGYCPHEAIASLVGEGVLA